MKTSRLLATERVEILDTLRVVATFGVLFIHLSGWFLLRGAEPRALYDFLADISRFSVPMFVFISAALFYLKYCEKKPEIDKYYKGRFYSIVVPYVIVSLIYYFYRMSILSSPNIRISLRGLIAVKYFINRLFTKSIFSHLYFVPAIIMFYISAPFILRGYKKNKLLTIIGLIAIDLTFVFYMNKNNFPGVNWRWTIFPYLIFVVFGFLFGEYYQKIKKMPKEVIISLLISSLFCISFIYGPYNNGFSLVWYARYIYDTLFGAFFLFLFLLINFPDKIKTAINYMSRKSFGIYLFHYLIIDFFFGLIVRKVINPPLNPLLYVILLIVIIIGSLILYYPMEKFISYLKFGFRVRENKEATNVQK